MIKEFGVLPDGTRVEEIILKKGELEASILTFGAIIRDLKIGGQTVVLGFETLQDYLDHSPYFGGDCWPVRQQDLQGADDNRRSRLPAGPE